MIAKRTGMILGLGCAFVGVVAAATYAPQMLEVRRTEKLDAAKKILREVAVATHTRFVDDCGGQYPFPGNVIPPALTTPIAYLGFDPIDPYGKSGERLLYINQPGNGNGSLFLIVSRGPDGDLDILSNAETETLPIPFLPLEQANAKQGERETTVSGGWWAQGITAIEQADGTWRDVPTFEAMTIPETVVNLPVYMADRGIVAYDPTNGAFSNGDLLFERK